MKRLWKVIPPCLSDVLGFEAVLNETEGLGIIDDPSRYKPIRMGQGGGRPAEARSDRAARMRGVRVMNSDIRNEDIITGTENKVMQTFERGMEQYSPNFVLLCCAPAASMINSDLEYAAQKITQQSGLPAAEVRIDGEKDYLYGIGTTLETLGRILLTPQETIPGTVNLLGANSIDWTKETLESTVKFLTDCGWQVLSNWGMKETTQNLKQAAAAQVNVVVSEAGLKLARFMEAEFGIPYVKGAPFGAKNAENLALQLDGRKSAGYPAKNTDTADPEILIVAEQFTANAVRETLLKHGLRHIRVLSFYDMDRSSMLPGDKKLTGEDDFAAQANADAVRLIIADADYRPLVTKDLEYVSFPNGGSFSPVSPTQNFDMTGELLDLWLEERGVIHR